MAVFHQNICKFNLCGRSFNSLLDLIRHIEEKHIDTEPKKDVKNIGLPLSCILPIFECQNNDGPSSLDLDSNTFPDSHVHNRKPINSPAASLSTTPTEGSEMEEDLDSDSGQSSIDSWATMTPNADPLAKFHRIMSSSISGSPSRQSSLDENNNSNSQSQQKPSTPEARTYVCGVEGCTKIYRSSNSLNHHRRSAHKVGNKGNQLKPVINNNKEEKLRKEYRCVCNKLYKTSHGLKNHYKNHHKNADPSAPMEYSMVEVVEVKTESPVTSMQPVVGKNGEVSPTTKESLNTIIRMKNINQSKSNENGCSMEAADAKVLPMISAPTLQQHLLSPIVPKIAANH